MGMCTTACGKYIKSNQDVKIEDVDESKAKLNIQNIIEQYQTNENYSKVVFLQTRIKRFLAKNHAENKKKSKYKSTQKESSIDNKNNINVNINVNVNMSKDGQNSCDSFNVKNALVKINSDNDNQNQNNRNLKSNNEQAFKIGSIVIPSVKVEFSESHIFTQDPFAKSKKQNKHDNKDPREGPMDDQRRAFPIIIEDEFSYAGEWKNGKRDGFGVLSWKNISKYIGEFKDDRVFGFGLLYHHDGDIYTGNWNDFQAQGIGSYKTKKDAKYEGYWENDKQNGFGMEVWLRGSNYSGEYVNGNKEGYGVLNFEGNGGYEGK